MTDLPKAKTRPASNWSAIWVLPLIALVIGGWLGWRAYNEQQGVVPLLTSGAFKPIFSSVWAERRMADRLAAMPTQALVATRSLLREAGTRSFSQQLDVERDTQSALGRTHDYIEGVMAFRQKRPAQFKGE